MEKKKNGIIMVYNEISNNTDETKCQLTIYKINKHYKFKAKYGYSYNNYKCKTIISDEPITWNSLGIDNVLEEMIYKYDVKYNLTNILIENAMIDRYSPFTSILGLHTWRLASHIYSNDYLIRNDCYSDYHAICICFNLNYELEVYGIQHIYPNMSFEYSLLGRFPSDWDIVTIADHGMFNENTGNDKYQLWFGISQDKQLQKKVNKMYNKISIAIHNQLTDFTHIVGIQNIIINYVF
jgi:hypothetical protein